MRDKIFFDNKLGAIKELNNKENDLCELCSKKAELRPYGKNGEWICFSCGMKDEKTTSEMFAKRINGFDTIIIKKD
jgi:hypothetical protein